MLNTLNSATRYSDMPPPSTVLCRHLGQHDVARVAKRAPAAASAPEARGAVYQPVIEGWPVIRPERVNERIGDFARSEMLSRLHT